MKSINELDQIEALVASKHRHTLGEAITVLDLDPNTLSACALAYSAGYRSNEDHTYEEDTTALMRFLLEIDHDESLRAIAGARSILEAE